MNTLPDNFINHIAAGSSQSDYMQLEVDLANWSSSTLSGSTNRDFARLTRYLGVRSMQRESLRSLATVR